jgi:O-antigen/teichoic acid export membrane protein
MTDNETKLEINESSRPRPSLIINAISNWVALAVNIAVGFVLTPYIIEHLGTVQYGIWALVASIIGYYGLLDLGVSSAIVRYVARYAGQKKYESLNQVINTAIVIFSLAGSIAILASILLADPLTRFFNIEANDYTSFKRCIWLLGITAGLMLPGNVLGVAIIAHERFIIRNAVNITTTLLRCFLSIYILYKGGKLLELCWVNFGLGIFGILLNLGVLKLFFRHITLSLKFVKKPMFFTLFSFGLLTSIIQIGNLLRTKLDTIVIGRYLNMDSVTTFSIAAFLCGYLSTFIISCSGVSQPRLAALAGQSNHKTFTSAIMRYSVIISNMVAAGGLVMYLLCEDFLKLWAPGNFKDTHTASIVVSILLLAVGSDLMVNVSFNALLAVKKHKYYAYQTIAEGIVHLTISIILVRSLGIYGVAIGAAIPALLSKFIVQPLYCCKIFGLNWWGYMSKIILKPCLLLGSIILFINSSGISYPATSYAQLIIKGIIILSLYLSTSYFLCLDKQARQKISAKFVAIKIRMGWVT